MRRTLNSGGKSSAIFSSRPGCSSPPVQYSTAAGATPYSSERIPRIHTGAVIWYSGLPTRLPIRSFGSRTPLFADTKIEAWRNIRDGNTGIAIKGGSSRNSETVYDDKDISATSNSP
jgi:hypothetical protein